MNQKPCCATPSHEPHAEDCGLEEYQDAAARTWFNAKTGLVHCGHCGGEHPGGHPLLPVWPTHHQMEQRLRNAYARHGLTEDEVQRLIWQVGYLMREVRTLLAGKRPQWWRDCVRWWNSGGWTAR